MKKGVLLLLSFIYIFIMYPQDTLTAVVQKSSKKNLITSKKLNQKLKDTVDAEISDVESLEDTTDARTSKKLEKEKLNKDERLLRSMARERAVFLQKELELDHYMSLVVQKKIYEYSVKANRIIQSELPYYQKTRELNAIIYAQNDEMKELLTVDQFYRYKNLKF